jgi:hypothetical protein
MEFESLDGISKRTTLFGAFADGRGDARFPTLCGVARRRRPFRAPRHVAVCAAAAVLLSRVVIAGRSVRVLLYC